MVGHRVFPRALPSIDDSVPRLEVQRWFGWNAMLLGWNLERHPGEWTLWLHVGPFALSIQRVP